MLSVKNYNHLRLSHLRRVRDARQRLPSKAERGHVAEVAELPQLGGREPLAHDREVLPADRQDRRRSPVPGIKHMVQARTTVTVDGQLSCHGCVTQSELGAKILPVDADTQEGSTTTREKHYRSELGCVTRCTQSTNRRL